MLHNGNMKSPEKKEGSTFDKEPDTTGAKHKNSNEWKKNLIKKHTLIKMFVVALVLAGAGGSTYFFLQYQNSKNLLNNSVLGTQAQAEKIIEEVAKKVELPNETPTVATVSDVTKLQKQTFFANAKNGDKVLIYKNAKKAILYRPSTGKIVEFGPVNLGSSDAPAQNETTATPVASLKPVRVAIYNGTTIPRLANTVERDLKEKAPYVTVIAKGNASKQTYAKTLIADMTGKNTAEAQNLAQLLSGEVGKLPAGESATSSAEIVVILGR
jgi:hypothetical protein